MSKQYFFQFSWTKAIWIGFGWENYSMRNAEDHFRYEFNIYLPFMMLSLTWSKE